MIPLSISIYSDVAVVKHDVTNLCFKGFVERSLGIARRRHSKHVENQSYHISSHCGACILVLRVNNLESENVRRRGGDANYSGPSVTHIPVTCVVFIAYHAHNRVRSRVT